MSQPTHGPRPEITRGATAATSPAGDHATGTTISMRTLPKARVLSRREAGWLLRRCGRKGHVLAWLADPHLAERSRATGPDGDMLRCLRCGTYLLPDDPATDRATTYGSAAEPIALSALPLVLRGAHGRQLAFLRVLAVERFGKGLLLLSAAAALFHLAHSHLQVAEWLDRVAMAAVPLGQEVGWDVQRSKVLDEALRLLGSSSTTFYLLGALVTAYGVVQLVEGIGLWGGWRWAEYLAVVATSAFVPLEVYEIVHQATPTKIAALVVNLVAVGYIAWKGRLFGIRGGHEAYLREVREATLLADELVLARRSPAELTGHALV